jgi:hypothetical protein
MLPSVAVAQPYNDPNQPPPPPDGYQQPPPPPPSGYQQPPPGYQPMAAPLPMASLRRGLTGELNLGLGFIWARNGDGQESDTEVALAGLSAGIGGWLNPQMALTLRGAGATYSTDVGVGSARFTTGVVGPSLQYWLDDRLWLGGGAGLGFAAITIDGADTQPDPETGFGLDLRAGYTFTSGTANTFNVSVEYNPTFFDVGDGQSLQINSFGILFGYQHL